MVPLMCLSCRKVILFCFLLFLFVSCFFFAYSDTDYELKSNQQQQFLARRLLKKDLESDQEENLTKKKITTSSSSSSLSSTTKNQTKITKPTSSSTKNQTKLIKRTNLSTKNQTKLINTSTKPSNSTNGSELKKKFGSTTKSTYFTKPISESIKKPSDLSKLTSPKNKTSKPTSTKTQGSQITPPSNKRNGNDGSLSSSSSEPNKKAQNTDKTKEIKNQKKEIKPFWLDDEEDDDLVAEFRDLTTRFQQTLIPDLERISTTSKIYINKANKEITKNFKPYFGNKYSSTIASAVSCIFILVPLILVSLVFNRFKAYFSLQKILIFIQVYLSIYFSILCLSSLVTGVEPLRFFYATSRSTYIWLQVLQTLAYVFYLVLLLMYLVLVFSTKCGPGLRLLGLAQTFVGFAIGLHYYVAVFHRVVLHQPPKTNWKVHGVYATCFLLICLFSRAERRKKGYLGDGSEEGKKN